MKPGVLAEFFKSTGACVADDYIYGGGDSDQRQYDGHPRGGKAPFFIELHAAIDSGKDDHGHFDGHARIPVEVVGAIFIG